MTRGRPKDNIFVPEKTKEIIKTLWNQNISVEKIKRLIPYSSYHAANIIHDMKKSGELPERDRTMAKKRVVDSFENGINIDDISQQFGLSNKTVVRYLWESNRSVGRLKMTDRTLEMIAMLEEGKSQSEVARLFGVSRQNVWDAKKRHEKNLKKVVENNGSSQEG